MVRREGTLMKDPLLVIARQAIHTHITGGDPRQSLAREAGNAPRGCFVSLKKRARLRGCMGTISPTQPTLEEEIISNALAAALRDPRFQPVRLEELDEILISLDLLSPLEAVAAPDLLDPRVFGLLVRAGKRTGVLLPDLPGVRSVEKQIEICREKAGIEPEEEIGMQRFTVERISE
jgi:AmmeMemoRadiSam system protein A